MISYSPYELTSKFWTKKGALLKIEFQKGLIGYADCHPWESLGDLPLQKQIELLKKGKTTPLTNRALFFAKLDALARKEKRNLFENLPIPISNAFFLTPEDISEKKIEGHTHIKVKLGNNLEQEIRSLKTLLPLYKKVKWRFDFNEKLKEEELIYFHEAISEWKDNIDYYEDPIAYNQQSWQKLQKQLGIPFACDHKVLSAMNLSFPLVIKPAIHDETLFLNQTKLIFTSYLDHPLGQMQAAYVAAIVLKIDPQRVDICGFLTHEAYHENAYSKQLQVKGPHLYATQGTGFGFDQLLENENWL